MRPGSKRAAALLAALVSFAPDARAETIADGTSFSMELDPRLTDLCVFIPEGKADPTNCEGMDTAAAASSVRQQEKAPIFAGVGHVKDGTLMIMVAREPAQSEVKPEKLDAFVATLRRGMAQGGMELTTPSPPVVTRINGLQVIEVSDVARGPRDTKLWMSASSIVAASGVYMMWTTTEGAHASDASDVVEATLATVKAAPPTGPTPVEKTVHTGDLFGRVVGGIAGLAFLGFIVWLAFRNRGAPMPMDDESSKRPKRKRKVVSWEKSKD